MARYHFNIRNGHGFTIDDEGLDLASHEAARVEAIKGARSLLRAEVLDGTLDLNGQIEITDERHGAVMTVHFVDALKVNPVEQSALGR